MTRIIADAVINFRATKISKEKWSGLAEQDNLSLAEWIKNACRSKSRSEYVDERVLLQALIDLRRDLNSGVGNNLNQIAHHANSTHVLGPIDAAISDYYIMRERINEVIRRLDQ